MDKGEWKGPDSDRPLTKEGLRKMKKAAKGMHHLNLKIDLILTSPFRRAYDTAVTVAKELKLKKKLRIIKSLAVDGDPKALVRYLALGFRSWESVLLVAPTGGGKTLSDADRAALQDEIRADYDAQADPRYGAARLWIDAIIDPAQTREVLIEALEACALNPDAPRFNPGVLQT